MNANEREREAETKKPEPRVDANARELSFERKNLNRRWTQIYADNIGFD
jgi:hypothetical protein